MSERKLKILIYNYLQPDEGGGGVGVYSENLATALTAAGHHVITLSSGDVYSLFGTAPRLRFRRDRYDRALIVNAPVIAPAADAWDDLDRYDSSPALDGLAQAIRLRFGEIDVLHFQNVEGLTRSFIETLRAVFPRSRFVFSLHNYNAVCPQVDLWFQDRQPCVDYGDGLNCTRCHAPRQGSAAVRRARRLRPLKHWAFRLAPAVFAARRAVLKGVRRLGGGGAAAPGGPAALHGAVGRAAAYRAYRASNARLLADTFDHVLAVSRRTMDVAARNGLAPANLSVSYIGTRHRAVFDRSEKIRAIGPRLHIAYLGYMRRSKGFDLLLDALALMPDDLARATAVTVAAKQERHPDGYGRLMALAGRYGEIRYFDGFTHHTLDGVLSGVNLGVVPPVWEDNLPQVAIEMVARGIPILTSDRGGAQEIAGVPDFVFAGGSAAELAARLAAIARGEIPLARFWSGDVRLVSMEAHVDELLGRYYRPADSADAGAGPPGRSSARAGRASSAARAPE